MLPGLGFGEILGLWERFETASQRFAVCFGLGLVLDTIAFSLGNYGPILFGRPESGTSVITAYGLLLMGLAMIVVSITKRRKFLFETSLRVTDAYLVALIAILSFILGLYLSKFPIFPEFQSVDYSAHVKYAEQLASGSSPPGVGFLYYGVRFQLASALLLIGGEGLITARITMAILVVLSPFLFYLVSTEIFDSHHAGVIVAAVYALSGTIWFVTVFNTGLYANFFGILITLFMIVVMKWLIDEPKSKLLWLVFTMTLFTAYFSHYSTVSVIPAIMILALLQFKRERSKFMNYFWPTILLILPLIAVVVLRPTFLNYLIGIAVSGGGSVSNTTFLSEILSPVPVLSYVAAEVSDDLALVALILLSIAGAYGSVKSKKTFMLLPLLWLVSLLVAAPIAASAWRFSIEALVPLTLISGYGIFVVVTKFKKRWPVSGQTKWTSTLVLLLILTSVAYGSWGQGALTDALTNSNSTAQAQRDVYTAIYWLKNNTPQDSTYLSLTDWRLTYTSLMIGRTTYYKYFSDENQSLEYSKSVGAEYIIITRAVTLQIPPLPLLFPWNTFKQDSNLTQIYSNADVRVYQIT